VDEREKLQVKGKIKWKKKTKNRKIVKAKRENKLE